MTADATTGISLDKRHSGVIDRRGDSAARFREKIGEEYREEIRRLRNEDAEKDVVIADLKHEIHSLHEWQKRHEPTLLAADQIVSAGAAFTWIIKLIVGITMLIGGLAGSYEILKRWTH